MPDAPDRNNEFIYSEIGWLWAINMICNGLWLPTFQMNNTLGFFIAELLIIVMLGSALLMSKMANEAQDELNQIETIGFKWGTSVYSGWLSAATILNTSILLKHSGIADGWNEELWAVIILWVAVAIYGVNSFLNNDAVYAGVFVWACFGIRS